MRGKIRDQFARLLVRIAFAVVADPDAIWSLIEDLTGRKCQP